MKRRSAVAWAAVVTAWASVAEAQPAAPPRSLERFDHCSTSSEAVHLLATQARHRGSEGFEARGCPSGSTFDALETTPTSGDGWHGLALRGRAGMGLYVDGNDDSAIYAPTLALSVKELVPGWQATTSYTTYVRASRAADVISAASPPEDGTAHHGTLRAETAMGRARFGVEGDLFAGSDLLGMTAGAFVSHELADGQLTPMLSYRWGHDERGRAGTPLDAHSREIVTHLLDGGVSVRVDPATTLVLVATAALANGDSSAPGQYVPVFSPDVARRLERGTSASEVARLRLDITQLEQLPTSRERFALLQRVVHHFETGSLRFDERLYIDAWGLKSSTTDVRSWHPLGPSLTLGPHLRFHVQDGVDFWRRAYATLGTDQGFTLPPHRTLDTTLGPLLEMTVGGALRWTFSRRVALDLLADGIYTELLDALFVTDRWGFFTTATLELRID